MQPGTRISRYEILSAIGKGGMGEVWKARDTRLGREVAIETLPAEFSSGIGNCFFGVHEREHCGRLEPVGIMRNQRQAGIPNTEKECSAGSGGHSANPGRRKAFGGRPRAQLGSAGAAVR